MELELCFIKKFIYFAVIFYCKIYISIYSISLWCAYCFGFTLMYFFELKKYDIFHWIIFFVEIAIFIISITSAFFCYISRNDMINEIKDSPLDLVNDAISPDFVNSVLNVSSNPENEQAKKELYERWGTNK